MVLLAGGGTGGHLFPGIALADEVVTRHPKNDVIFVGTDRGLEARVVPQNGFVFEAIKSRGLKGMGVVKMFLGLMLLPVSFFSAIGLLRKYKPDVVVGVGGEDFTRMVESLAGQLAAADEAVMLYEQLGDDFRRGLQRAKSAGAESLTPTPIGSFGARARPTLLRVDAARFLADRALQQEVFGPVSMVVVAKDASELERVAEALEGQLTATIHGTPDELRQHTRLVDILQRKVGRLLFNGYPTGVEVGHAVQHGGPYPASSDSRSTSVGTSAIPRYARPVCFQNFPEDSLPPALRGRNELDIWRLVNGRLTKDDVSGVLTV